MDWESCLVEETLINVRRSAIPEGINASDV